MLQFLYPIGLLAAIGIVIPVIIHLWNIKNGKTLKIGSIALLGNPSNQRSRNLKVTNWPLLLIRSLLILLIAFLIAKPMLQSKQEAIVKHGWLLLEKSQLQNVWKSNKNEIDSLLKKGYELHDFNVGFAKLELKDTATVFSKPADLPLSYYSLIRQLDKELTSVAKVYLYTGNSLGRFQGTQPASSLNLTWKVDKAFNEIAVDEQKPIAAATDLQVLILNNSLPKDAQYVKAAIRAIADFTKTNIQIKDIQSAAQITSKANLMFWLSDKPLSLLQVKNLPKGITVFNYGGQKKKRLNSVILNQDGALQNAELYQRTEFSATKNKSAPHNNVIWTDGYGDPLLTVDSTAQLVNYQFYSRFNQQWTDLAWTNGLVMALMPLVLPHHSPELGTYQSSYVTLPHNEANAKSTETIETVNQQKPLSKMLWWVILIVFLVERLMAYNKIKRTYEAN